MVYLGQTSMGAPSPVVVFVLAGGICQDKYSALPRAIPLSFPPKACLAPLATTTGLGAGSGRAQGAGQTFQAVQKVGSPKTVSHQQQFVNSIRGASARPNREKQISSQSRVNPRPIFFTCILPTALMYLGWFVATKYQHMRLIKLKKKQILRLMGD